MTELDSRGSETAGEGPEQGALQELTPASLGVYEPPGLPEHLRLDDANSDARIAAKLKLQGVKLGAGMVAPRVFWPALIVIVTIAVVAIAAPGFTNDVLQTIQAWIVETLGWYYVLVVAAFIFFSLAVCFSKYGKIKLGREHDKPEFGIVTWFSMLFAAGMGIGLVFYGVGEPLTYATVDPKPGWEGNDAQLAKLAMAQTFVHWGLHPWAIYAVIGLAVAYTVHRRGRPVSIRWVFEPLIGERVKGWIGDIIDILAIFGTIFGVATSLGLGVQQIASGMESIGIVETADNVLLVVLIVVITFIATVSVVSGVGRGMKWLSNINLSLAGVLLISVLLLGPTLFLFQNLVESLGAYLANWMNLAFDVGAYTSEEGRTWAGNWTLFYWGWWMSWAPFVGIFIARISRGRTVRQFITGVLLVPTIVGFLWFAVLGGTGIHRQFFGQGDLVDPAEGVVAERALFDVLGTLPMGAILSVLAIILVAIFFITSSDSGSLVIDMLASGGHPNPPRWSRVLFSVLEGALAVGLLLAGGLEALQAAALATALPFSVLLLLMCVATLRSLHQDHIQTEAAKMHLHYQELSRRVTADLAESLESQVSEMVEQRMASRLMWARGVFDRRDRSMNGRRAAASRTKSAGARKRGAPD